MNDERALLDALLRVRAAMLGAERRAAARIAARGPGEAESTRNFLHYHAMRAFELRPLQDALGRFGLSSLGRCEAHALASVDAVIGVLGRLTGEATPLEPSEGAPSFDAGRGRLRARTEEVLGPEPPGRSVRIMVTLSADDAGDPAPVRLLVERGMDVARINCAHDDVDVWAALVRNVRAASEATGRACRVAMDLGGPKLRTGPVRAEIVVRRGDKLRLCRAPRTGEPARVGDGGEVVPAFVSCSLPEALASVTAGERVFFDDGKIGAVVEEVDAEGLVVRVTFARDAGGKLREDKGINLPDSALAIDALTELDRAHLPFVAKNADLVGISFVQSPEDVEALEDELRRHESSARMVLKIETKRGFEALPRILVRALGARPFGVMIARGDLAVECGYERLAEVQEEMLWLCEAAHVPVIWATQVLDRLSRKGMPTRAEITDAAMAERAEAVMLNKGAHVAEAVRVLDDILRRMAAHQYKKTPALRPLAVSRADPLA